MVQYGSTVVHEFSLGEYQTVEEVVEAARGIDQRGGEETRTALGINVARYDSRASLTGTTQGPARFLTHLHTCICRSEAFQRGGRPGAQKVMIVITDGESHDSPQLVQAVGDSERDNITMYAIAVSPSIFNLCDLMASCLVLGQADFLPSLCATSSLHPDPSVFTPSILCTDIKTFVVLWT